MFEPKFDTFLSTLNEEERKLAIYIRNKQIISEFKSMSDEDFDRLKEIVLNNLKEIENLFNIYIYKITKGKEISFEFDNLYKQYFDDVTYVVENEGGISSAVESIYRCLAAPFHERKDEMILALINREAYIKYLETHTPTIQADALLNLYNELNSYLQGKLGADFQLKLSRFPKFFKMINTMMKENGELYLDPTDIRSVEISIDLYNDKNKNNDLKEKSLNSTINHLETTFNIIRNYFKYYYIFLDQQDKRNLVISYKEFVEFNNDIKNEEFYDSIEDEIKNKYSRIFISIDSSNSKKVYKFFKKNITLILNYISFLKLEIEKHYKYLYIEEKEMFMKKINEYFDIMSHLGKIDISTFANHPDIEDFKVYYDQDLKRKSLINCFYAIKYYDEDKLKKIVSYEMYEKIKTIFENSGCMDIEINEKIIEDIKKYIEMQQRIDNIHSITEEEIVLNTFEKVKKLS